MGMSPGEVRRSKCMDMLRMIASSIMLLIECYISAEILAKNVLLYVVGCLFVLPIRFPFSDQPPLR